MSQYGFFFDQSRCTGCRTCAVACKNWNSLAPGPLKYLRIYEYEKGTFPNVRIHFQWIPCYHCEKAVCIDSCPFGAISKEEKYGAVLIDSEKCVGCRLCYDACPYGAFVFESDKAYETSADTCLQVACSQACPAHVNVPRYIGYIQEGRPAEAVAVLREKLPFPSICGRICSHPCETKCHRARIDEPVSIRVLKRYATDHDTELWKEKSKVFPSKGKRVAVVGSGPAGLTAAYYLAKLGHDVTVFEALPEAGGMMRACIPDYRLPKDILREEIEEIKKVGVEIKTNTRIESIDKFRAEGYNAVFLAVGAHEGMKLGIDGEDSAGVMDCISFLRDVSLGKEKRIGSRVAVVGGGNGAIDSARTALRLGAKEVTVFYRRTSAEMPAYPEEIIAALDEGIKIEYLVVPTKIASQDGQLSLECIRMQLGEPDADGRRRPKPIKGTEFNKQYDHIIAAIGQQPLVPKKFKVALDRGNVIKVDPQTMVTNREGIFAGGDATTGPASVVEAIASGRQAAISIDKYLGGPGMIDEELVPAAKTEPLPNRVDLKRHRIHSPQIELSERSQGFAEVELTLSDQAALDEAWRCFKCDPVKAQKCTMCIYRLEVGEQPICVLSCPTRALDFGSLSNLAVMYGDRRDMEDMPSSRTTEPAVLFKPHTEKRRLVPYDAERALELLMKRDPLPPVFNSPDDVTEIPEGTIGRGELVIKHPTADDLMRRTRSDEG